METRPPYIPPVPPGAGRIVRHNPANKIGWILSGVMVLALGAVVLIMSMGNDDSTPPTLSITKPGFFEVHEIKVSPAAFLGGALPSGAGNAADDYRQAVEIYRAHVSEFADAFDPKRRAEIAKGKYTPPLPVMNALEKVYALMAAGAAKKEMRYTTPDLIAVRYADDQASQLIRLGEPLAILADVYHGAGKFAEEEKVLWAMFILGWHMEREHVRATTAFQGLDVQGGAVGALGDLYSTWEPQNHASQMKAIQEYAPALDRLNRDYNDKLFVIWKKKPQPGDVFATVQRDQDRAWRVDALLMVGAIRYTHSGNTGDQKVAQKLLAKYADDPDPYVKAAAVASRDLTSKGFDLVGTPPGQ